LPTVDHSRFDGEGSRCDSQYQKQRVFSSSQRPDVPAGTKQGLAWIYSDVTEDGAGFDAEGLKLVSEDLCLEIRTKFVKNPIAALK
jgi:hypothetical protein